MAQDSSRPDFWDQRYQQGVMPWDGGEVPRDFKNWCARLTPGARVLVPGCGTGYEVAVLDNAGARVDAIDFSPEAVGRAQAWLGARADLVRQADFFALGASTYDFVYERAFLCALPPRVWTAYAAKMAECIRPGGALVGYFFLKSTAKGPPFGTTEPALCDLLASHFRLAEQRPVEDSLPVFAGHERWMHWQRI